MSWENDKELMQESQFLRWEQGQNEFKFSDDGTKVRSFGKAGVEFNGEFRGELKILSIRAGPILKIVAEKKKEFGTLVGRTLKLTREGTTKEDTRYKDIVVE